MFIDIEQLLDYDSMPLPNKLVVYAVGKTPPDAVKSAYAELFDVNSVVPLAISPDYRASRDKKSKLGVLTSLLGISEPSWWKNPEFGMKIFQIENKNIKIGLPKLKVNAGDDLKYLWYCSGSGLSNNYLSIISITSPELEKIFPEKQFILGLTSDIFMKLIYSQRTVIDGWYPINYSFYPVRGNNCVMFPVIQDDRSKVQNTLRDYAEKLSHKNEKTFIPGHLYIRKDSKNFVYLYLGEIKNTLISRPIFGGHPIYYNFTDVKLNAWDNPYYDYSHRKLSGNLFLKYTWEEGFGTKSIIDFERKRKLDFLKFIDMYIFTPHADCMKNNLYLSSEGSSVGCVDLGEVFEFDDSIHDLDSYLKGKSKKAALEALQSLRSNEKSVKSINFFKKWYFSWYPDLINENPDLKSLYIEVISDELFIRLTNMLGHKIGTIYSANAADIMSKAYDKFFEVEEVDQLVRIWGSDMDDFFSNVIINSTEKEKINILTSVRDRGIDYVKTRRQQIAEAAKNR